MNSARHPPPPYTREVEVLQEIGNPVWKQLREEPLYHEVWWFDDKKLSHTSLKKKKYNYLSPNIKGRAYPNSLRTLTIQKWKNNNLQLCSYWIFINLLSWLKNFDKGAAYLRPQMLSCGLLALSSFVVIWPGSTMSTLITWLISQRHLAFCIHSFMLIKTCLILMKMIQI